MNAIALIILILVFILPASIVLGWIIYQIYQARKKAKANGAQPINYPETPSDEMYIKILIEIEKIKNASDLYATYNNIKTFETMVAADEYWLTSRLKERWENKETLINKGTRFETPAEIN